MSASDWRLICPAEDAASVQAYSNAEGIAVAKRIANQLGLRFNHDRETRKVYVGSPPAPPKQGPSIGPPYLQAPYYYQFDSKTAQGARMCFSSTNAMLLKFLKPNTLTDSPNADDEYLRRVMTFGDTTQASAQISTLRHFGLDATFRKDLTWADLDSQLSKGIPVPIGFLHRGPHTAPTGGGHWALVVGRAGTEGYRVHDPAGKLDLASGWYLVGGSGEGASYSKALLGPRWMVEGPGTGWGIIVRD